MSALKDSLKDLVRKSGYSIKKIRPSVEGNYADLYDFFSNNSDEAEIFMKYVYSLIVKEGDWVLDVGANHGLHTGPLSKLVGEKGKVIAIEAVPAHLDDIKKSSPLNNIELINKAVTNPTTAKQQKEIQFTYYAKHDGYSGIKSRSHIDDVGQQLTVPTTTIDDVLSKHKASTKTPITFAKVDVEGGDFHALQGAQKVLSQHKPIVVLENSRQKAADLYGYTKDDFFNYFEKLGYKFFQFTGQPFTKNDWHAQNIYWEIWLVHQDSERLNFFTYYYQNLAETFVDDKLISA